MKSQFSDHALHSSRFVRSLGAMFAVAFLTVSYAYADKYGDGDPIPPEDDPSAFTGPYIEDLPGDLSPANEDAFEGGETGTVPDTQENNSVAEEDQRDDGVFNIPTNGPPSPLFGAAPFSQKMLRFEEFGPEHLNLHKNKKHPPKGWQSMPAPTDAQSGPDGMVLESFLNQQIYPTPTKLANDQDRP